MTDMEDKGGMMDQGMMDKGKGMMDESGEDESNETPSVFLSREQLGGRKCKAGDTLTLKVTDVDPETGDVQADLTAGGETQSKSTGYEEAFNEAVPEES